MATTKTITLTLRVDPVIKEDSRILEEKTAPQPYQYGGSDDP
jgi:hypothetical protein